MNWRTSFGVAAIGLAALTFGACTPRQDDAGGNPDGANALWDIVHGQCVPNAIAHGDPKPCLTVDLAGGYAVLKDRRGATQVLVIPTAKVTGVEDPQLLAPTAPYFFADAWNSRKYVVQLAGHALPRDAIGLAVNSVDGRSQNQLHVHVDCLKADVRAALKANLDQLTVALAPLPTALAGHRYEAMRLDGADLARRDPFRIVAAQEPAARAAMGPETLVVAGATFADGKPGFVLLADRADPAAGDFGSGSELLAHDCAAAGE